MENGVVVGVDQTQEWILPWWYGRYKAFNGFPVLFVDFGMSRSAREWCSERGEVKQMENPVMVVEREFVVEERRLAWEEIYGNGVWQSRKAWFQKPLALLTAGFEVSVWIDLDCEIRGSIAPLFSYGPFALAKDVGTSGYNTGVVVARRGASLLREWEQVCRTQSDLYVGDQQALNPLLKEGAVQTLPQIYNWRMCLGDNAEAQIIHWTGLSGKEMIQLMIGLEKSLV